MVEYTPVYSSPDLLPINSVILIKGFLLVSYKAPFKTVHVTGKRSGTNILAGTFLQFYPTDGCHKSICCECIKYSGTYGKDYGRFTSPDFPRPYPKQINCLLFTFVAGAHEIIEINFTKFDIYNLRQDCTLGDYIKVYLHLEKAEVNEVSKWNELLCNNLTVMPAQFFSSGPVLILELHTTSLNHNATGFAGTFRFIDSSKYGIDGQKIAGSVCDYQFTSSNSSASQGYFYSHLYPSIYPNNIKCHYRFRARTRQRIRILFEEVNLLTGDTSCLGREDIVKVYDGGNVHAPVIAIICHIMANVEVISTVQSLYVEFHTGSSNLSGNGFKAKYIFQTLPELAANYLNGMKGGGPAVSATRTGCDMLIRSDGNKEGVFTSPRFPMKYIPNTVCKYKFEGMGKERIQLSFQRFSVVGGDNGSLLCDNKDSLRVYMMIDGRLERTDTLCGHSLPKPIMSNGPRLFAEFLGRLSPAGSEGFKAVYSFVKNFGIKTGNQLIEYPCAFTYKADSEIKGIFHSPNFPGQYPRNTECHYFFHNLQGNKIRIHFSYFSLEGESPCESSADFLEYSTSTNGKTRGTKLCGYYKPFHLQFKSRYFRFSFRSNSQIDGNGFNASYYIIESSHEHPDNYSSQGCDIQSWKSTWLIIIIILF